LHSLFGTFALTTLPRWRRRRLQVKSFLRDHLPALPPDVRARSWMGFDAGFSRALAQRGWVGITLPARYGGAGLDAFSRCWWRNCWLAARRCRRTGSPTGRAGR
jgi:alkylation response protein AidB-like acyl-CoA dehydrogenase